ncbi:hypothetical protein H2248_002158 [Termitomyces sp. 'cryptogamus']|nr:hypothetical protein H2248_002158 [Termitomyces sp. 'cryptogamus']
MAWPEALLHALSHERKGEHPRMARADLSNSELNSLQELALEHLRWRTVHDYLCVRCEVPHVVYWSELECHINENHKDDQNPRKPVYGTDYVMQMNRFGFRRQPAGSLILEPEHKRNAAVTC